jgi:hypothetical protein
MSKYLAATFGLAAMLIASPALAERSALESASVKAASDCVAAAALNKPQQCALRRCDPASAKGMAQARGELEKSSIKAATETKCVNF